jgi:hypothetical protein
LSDSKGVQAGFDLAAEIDRSFRWINAGRSAHPQWRSFISATKFISATPALTSCLQAFPLAV